MDRPLDPSRYLAIVLCAGLGTRLRPLTHYIPKTAVPLGKWPLAFHNIKALLEAGLSTVHCNTHFLAPLCEEELERATRAAGLPGTSVRFWREEALLETGGGVARIVQEIARHEAVPEAIIVVSGDVFADVPLTEMARAWESREKGVDAVLCSRALKKPQNDAMWVDLGKAKVAGFGRDLAPEIASSRGVVGRNFSGHQILSRELALSAPVEKMSSIDSFYRKALAQGKAIDHVDHHDSLRWFNVGTYAEYRACAQACADEPEAWAQSVPSHCLVAAHAHEKTGEGAVTFPGGTALRLSLVPWFFATRRVGELRTWPSLSSGESLATSLSSRLTADLFSSSSCLPGPFAASEKAPLVFRLDAPSTWELSHPILVPFEACEAGASLSSSGLVSLYGESETFLLITPARWQPHLLRR